MFVFLVVYSTIEGPLVKADLRMGSLQYKKVKKIVSVWYSLSITILYKFYVNSE